LLTESARGRTLERMKHWLGVLCVAAAITLIGLLIPTEGAIGDTRYYVFGLAGILALIALLKLASELMRPD
jgi:hypothetical protein